MLEPRGNGIDIGPRAAIHSGSSLLFRSVRCVAITLYDGHSRSSELLLQVENRHGSLANRRYITLRQVALTAQYKGRGNSVIFQTQRRLLDNIAEDVERYQDVRKTAILTIGLNASRLG